MSNHIDPLSLSRLPLRALHKLAEAVTTTLNAFNWVEDTFFDELEQRQLGLSLPRGTRTAPPGMTLDHAFPMLLGRAQLLGTAGLLPPLLRWLCIDGDPVRNAAETRLALDRVEAIAGMDSGCWGKVVGTSAAHANEIRQMLTKVLETVTSAIAKRSITRKITPR